MKLAVIADIHGNALALEAVLEDIARHGVDHTVNLGDHVSGPLEVARTADLLIGLDMTSILGDQDRRLLEVEPSSATAVARVDYRHLTSRHFDWLARLAPTLVLEDEVFLCHGSPERDNSYWLDRVAPDGSIRASTRDEIEAEAGTARVSLILCAHTHIPRTVRLRDGRLVVNPGSVGCPGYTGRRPVFHKVQAGTPDACYAIVERFKRGWSVSYRQVPYDNVAASEIAEGNGWPEWASALATGWLT